MSPRNDKGKAVTRYLTGHAGIPMLSWDGSTSRIDAPAPYAIQVMTDTKTWRFFEAIKEFPSTGLPFVVRYDKYLETVDQAVVGLRLSTFSAILSAHYTSIADRIDTLVRGD